MNPCCVHCSPECVYKDDHILPCGQAARCVLDSVFMEQERITVTEEGEWA